MRIHRPLLAAAATAAVAACSADLQPTPDGVSPPAVEEPAVAEVALGSAAPTELARFEGSWDAERRAFTIEMLGPRPTDGRLRTVPQASHCLAPSGSDGVRGAGARDSVEVVTLPETLNDGAFCFTGGWPSLEYAIGGAFCGDVEVRSFVPGTLSDVWVELDSMFPGEEYAAWGPPFSDASPATQVPPSDEYGLWSYGDLVRDAAQCSGSRCTDVDVAGGADQATATWIFRNPGGDFRFTGRVVASVAETCGDGIDDNCNDVADDGCGIFELGDACFSDADCASAHCSNGACAPPGFSYVPSGVMTMGSDPTEACRDTHEVAHVVQLTRPYFVAQTPVTYEDWLEHATMNPSFFRTRPCTDQCPVEMVDWFSTLAWANAASVAEGLTPCYTLTPAGCNDVADWSDGVSSCTGVTFAGLDCEGYRLPTEAEWEYAYRAGTTTSTWAGDIDIVECPGDGSISATNPADIDLLNAIAYWCGNSGIPCGGTCQMTPVASYMPNPWGLYDMAGLVLEWVWDGYEAYPTTVAVDPTGDHGNTERVYRGGSRGGNCDQLRAAWRDYRPWTYVSNGLGFRVVRTVP